MKALVIGGGSIGTRQLRNLQTLGVMAALVESDEQRRKSLALEAGITTFADLKAGLGWGVDFIVIATPSNLHVEQALPAARAGCHLFIEKPLSHTLERRFPRGIIR